MVHPRQYLLSSIQDIARQKTTFDNNMLVESVRLHILPQIWHGIRESCHGWLHTVLSGCEKQNFAPQQREYQVRRTRFAMDSVIFAHADEAHVYHDRLV